MKRTLLVTLVGIALAVACQAASAGPARLGLPSPGESVVWTGRAGDQLWSNAENWDPPRVPTAEDAVVLTNAASISLGAGCQARELWLDAVSAAFLRALDGASLKAELRGTGDVRLGDDVTFELPDAGYWVGGARLGERAALKLGQPDLGGITNLVGAATSVLQLNDVVFDGTWAPPALVTEASAWKGLLWLRQVTLSEADLSVLQTLGRVKFTAAAGSLAADRTFDGELVLEDEGERVALDLTGAAGAFGVVRRLSGAGTLASSAALPAYVLAVRDASAFTGSVRLTGAGSGLGVLFARAGSAAAPGLTLPAGETLAIGAGATWSAGRFTVAAGAELTVHGALAAAAMAGAGTVVMAQDGSLAAEGAFADRTAWSGRVCLYDREVFPETRVSALGNEASTIVCRNVTGALTNETIKARLLLEADGAGRPGFTVTGGAGGGLVDVAALAGGGGLVARGASASQVWRLRDVGSFSGALEIADGSNVSFAIGSGEASGRSGCIDLSDGMAIMSRRPWSAPCATAGDRLYVTGNPGDVLFRVTSADPGDFAHVQVSLLPEDPVRDRQTFGLKHDAATKELTVVAKSAPPSMDIVDVRLDYGADLASVRVVLVVENFWGGSGYAGVTGRVLVRDGNGDPVGSVGAPVVASGETVLGEVPLFGGRGADYSYEVKVEARATPNAEAELLAEYSLAGAVSYRAGDWIHENAKTFASTVAAEKSGTWSYASGVASVADGAIRIAGTEDGAKKVDFAANRETASDVVEVSLRLRATTELSSANRSLGDEAKAAFAFDVDPADGGYVFAVWNPTARAFERGWGAGATRRPDPTAWYDVRFLLNYAKGTVGYTVNGDAVTNAAGLAFFPLRPEQLAGRPVGKVRFLGQGAVAALDGHERKTTVAAAGGVEYVSFDAAVAALRALPAGSRVSLLWDATWHPTVADFGRTYQVDLGGHEVVVDEASREALRQAGYDTSVGADGACAVVTRTYAITFTNNVPAVEAEEGDEPVEPVPGASVTQTYTVEDNVFRLRLNEFACEGFDFSHWNTEPDGSGEHSYGDGDEIDMSVFGPTDLTLYAQWKPATRTVTVEPADEFVYIERVETNGVVHAGVRFFCDDAAKGTGRAVIPLQNASDLVVRYATDLERRFTEDSREEIWYHRIRADFTIPNEDQPEIYQPGRPSALLSPLDRWAIGRGVSASALAASPYALSSYRLDAPGLIDEASDIRIADFRIAERSCSFRVIVDGRAVGAVSAVREMIRVSDRLDGTWREPGSELVSLAEDGTVTVITQGASKFVKIVIPGND